MDAAYFSAIAALAGSVVGGSASFLSSWLVQSAQMKSQLLLSDKGRREEVYRTFVEEGSKLYIDALTQNTPDLAKTVTLYALLSRMRILSSPKVIEEADMVARKIVQAYFEPNMTLADLRKMLNENAFDPLRNFAESCREELEQMR